MSEENQLLEPENLIQEDRLIDSVELAYFLNCSEGEVKKLRENEIIPFVYVGTSVKFKKEEVLNALKEETKKRIACRKAKFA